MPDIRLVRPKNSHVVAWTALLAVIAVLIWLGSTFLFGDRTEANVNRQVGARANFGANRGTVLPLQTESFEDAQPLESRELGRLLRLRGVAESGVRRNAVWVRSRSGKRILVRFEPEPPEGALRRVTPGAGIQVDGYVRKIARAEFDAWMDTLRVVIPRPRPGTKFGDLPDSSFARVDSLFVKDYYISVLPEGIGGLQAAPPPVPRDSARRAGTSADTMRAPTPPAAMAPRAAAPPAGAVDTAAAGVTP